MGLSAILQKAAQTTIRALGDVAQTITFYSLTAVTENNTTGVPARTETSTTSRAILDAFTVEERQAAAAGVPGRDPIEIRSTDQKAIIAALDIPSVTPKASDRVVIDSVSWEVFLVQTDPAGAAWVLGLRRP